MTEEASRLSSFLRSKDSLLAQVVKYIFCGGIAVFVDQAVFYLLAWLVFPAMRGSDPVARLLLKMGFSMQEVSEAELARNYWIIKGICFVLANLVVYLLNVRFVFQAGRHRKPVEILLFFGSCMFQFFFIWLGGILITKFNWEVTYSNITMLLTSLAVNYAVRKKVVFKG